MKEGDFVIWVFRASRGYGFPVRILAKVIKFGRATVTIEVFNTTTGRFDNKHVKPASLATPTPDELEKCKITWEPG